MKIKLRNACTLFGKGLFKTLMRTFIFLFCATVFSLTPNDIVSQNSKIIIEEDKTLTVDQVFDLIMAQTDYNFFYEEGIFKDFPNVNVKKGVVKTNKLLKQSLFNGDFEITITNNYDILIKKKEPSSSSSITQDFEVSGTVTDQSGQPLPGANILEKGTTNGTQTDFDGKFSFEVADENVILVVSYLGFLTNEVALNGQSNIAIILQEDTAKLDEVVVVGYGSQSRRNITGAVGKLNADKIVDLPASGIDQAIAGQISGVNVVEATGSPGSTASIQIRGVATISAGTNPLLVIDGFPSEDLNINDINANDIESIEVLKDAASASIYGSRATNGVILITTKSGKSGKLNIDFNMYGGFQKVTNTYDMANAYEWAEYQTETFINQGSWAADGSDIPTLYQPYLAGTPGLIDTDWQDEIFREASIQNYQLSFSGGSERIKFYSSASIFDQEGIILGSDIKRYSFRANIESDVYKKPEATFIKHVKFGINLFPTYSKSNRVSESHHNEDGIVITGLYFYPQFAPYGADGSYNIGEQIEFGLATPPDGLKSSGSPALFENPVAVALERENIVKRARILTSTFLDFELFKDLNFKTAFTVNYSNLQDRLYRPSFLGRRASPAPTTATASSNTETLVNWINENTLNYKKTFGENHSLRLLAGYSFQKESVEITSLAGQGFANDDIHTLNAANTITSGSSIEEEWSLKSFFGRINYDYKGKYLVAASIRSDGSSRFGADNKWGVFPSVSLGWRLSEESFFSGLDNIINDFKLRASIGRTGNNQIPNYGAISRLGIANYNYGANLSSGLTTITSPNSNLGWETTDQYDIGFDLNFGKISIVADYYNSTTDGLLLDVPVPSYSGFTTSLQNLGKVENNGFEFAISANSINLGPVKWNSTFNIATNKNKLLELGPGQNQIITQRHKSEIGRPLGEYYLYNILGVYNTQAEIDATAHLSTAAPGDYIWEDVNEDGVIDGNDRKVVGNVFPDFTYGFSSNFEYKGFDLNISIQGSEGNETINFTKYFLTRRGDFANVTSDRINGRWQSPSQPGTGWARSDARERYYALSNYLVEDASFLRIRNITLGYKLPEDVINKIGLKKARVYFSSLNPFTFTKYTGYNPQVQTQIGTNGSPLMPGTDWGTYPIAKTFTVGLNLSF